MEPTSRPAAVSERIAVSRPEPGPLTKTSTFLTPCSCAWRAADSAAMPAAYGVDLREPLKPTPPDDAQLMTAPDGSVIETIVLLNVDLMWAWPSAMFFFSLRRGLRAADLACAIALALLNPGGRALARLLLAGDGALRALAGTGVRLRALTAHREAAAVAQALVGTDLDLVVAFDVVAECDELVVAEVLDADVLVDLRRGEDLVRAGTADAVDVREGDHHALVARDVNAGKTCHAILLRVGGGVEQDRCPGLRPRCPPRTGSDPACVVFSCEGWMPRLAASTKPELSPGAACGAGCSCRSP